MAIIFAGCEKEPEPEEFDPNSVTSYFEYDLVFDSITDTMEVYFFNQNVTDPDFGWEITINHIQFMNGNNSFRMNIFEIPNTFSIDTTLTFDNTAVESFHIEGYAAEDTLYGSYTEIYEETADTVIMNFHSL